MATYILLGTLTDEGAEKLRQHPEWIEEVRQDLESTGVRVIAPTPLMGAMNRYLSQSVRWISVDTSALTPAFSND